MSHIFISYSTKDKDYAYTLADDLRERGFNVWIDNDALRSSENWWRSIVDALTAADAIIVLMSPDAEKSRWVEREIHLSDNLRKPTFPLLLRGHNFPIFVTTQYNDVSDGTLPPEQFYNTLAEISPPSDIEGEFVAGDAVSIASERPKPFDPKSTDEVLKWADTREMEMVEDTTSPDFKSLIVESQKLRAIRDADIQDDEKPKNVPEIAPTSSNQLLVGIAVSLIIALIAVFGVADPFGWFVEYPIGISSSSNASVYIDFPNNERIGILEEGIEVEVLSRSSDFESQREYSANYLEVRYTLPDDNPARDIVELADEFNQYLESHGGNTITFWTSAGTIILPDGVTFNDIPVNRKYEGIDFNQVGFQGFLYEVQRGDTVDDLPLSCSSVQDVVIANPLDDIEEIRAGMILLIPGRCG